MDGALLINKHTGVSSFGVIEDLQNQLINLQGIKRRELPRIGHGGTLDPFATGLLIVFTGRAVKLSRYFLGAVKAYEGVMRFGETTASGDLTDPVIETSTHLPGSLNELSAMAQKMAAQPYLQRPPMHSAKKHNGQPLYELARQGIEVERESKLCHLLQFEINQYENARAHFQITCSSGTYIRTLAQDFGRLLGTVAVLETLNRTRIGQMDLARAMTVEEIVRAGVENGTKWNELPCWVDFNRMLDGYQRAYATDEEASCLQMGQQNVLFSIVQRAQPGEADLPTEDANSTCLAIYQGERLLAIARREGYGWGLERVFC